VTRVAIQLISTGGFYGAERTLLELASYLSQRGWESHILALEGRGAPELVRRAMERGISAYALGGDRVGFWTLLQRLRTRITRHREAIIHAHGYKADILLAALGAPRRLACLATCHTWYSDTPKMKVIERLDKRVLRGFDHVVAVSEEIRADLIASGVSTAEVTTIDNGITKPIAEPAARASVRAEFEIPAEDHLLVQVGRLARSKRSDLLLEAVARLQQTVRIRVLLVGEGGERESLIVQADRLGLAGKVTFCGYRSDVHRLLSAADLFVLSSNKEGLPIVLLEAMALGCPIVTTAVGAIPSVVRENESAWVVPAEDVTALGRAIDEALTHPRLAAARAARAKADFMARFLRDVMGRRYLDLYECTWRARGWR
jgi:glycosyltransferase involved in cell wall biosynthesis